MTTAPLARVKTAQEAEYEAKKREVEHKRQHIADLQQRIEDLRKALGQFVLEYSARLGMLQVKLEKLELEIDQLRLRIHWLVTRETPKGMEERVEQEFADRRQQVREDEDATQDARNLYEEVSQQQKDPAVLKELKRLYRELARRFHPDLAQSQEERDRRTLVMTEVNAAYEKQDRDTLMEIAGRVAWEEAETNSGNLTEKIAVLYKESQRLDEIIAKLNSELKSLEGSDAFQLRLRVEEAARKGYDYFQQLREALSASIKKKQEELAQYQLRYEGLLKRTEGEQIT